MVSSTTKENIRLLKNIINCGKVYSFKKIRFNKMKINNEILIIQFQIDQIFIYKK